MIKINCVQGESDWFKLRAGIPTASNFDKVGTYYDGITEQWVTKETLNKNMNDNPNIIMVN